LAFVHLKVSNQTGQQSVFKRNPGRGLVSREVAMNTPLITVIIVIALIVGSALPIINKACKSGHHANASAK
jgi:hypothetical protein